MQASEAFTGVVVGAGPSGLLAALPPDNTLAFQYTTAARQYTTAARREVS